MTPVRKPSELRASDVDRERIVALLAEAASDGRLTIDEHAERVQRAYEARTLGELAGLTRDLAAPGAQPLQLDDSRAVTAFFGASRRDGRWVMPGQFTVTAVGGKVILDLREAMLQSRHTIVQAVLLGGQLHMLVPDGVEVAVTSARNAGRLGPDLSPRAEPVTPPVPGGPPLIEVRTFSMAGRVRVHTPRRPGGRWRGRLGR